MIDRHSRRSTRLDHIRGAWDWSCCEQVGWRKRRGAPSRHNPSSRTRRKWNWTPRFDCFARLSSIVRNKEKSKLPYRRDLCQGVFVSVSFFALRAQIEIAAFEALPADAHNILFAAHVTRNSYVNLQAPQTEMLRCHNTFEPLRALPLSW